MGMLLRFECTVLFISLEKEARGEERKKGKKNVGLVKKDRYMSRRKYQTHVFFQFLTARLGVLIFRIAEKMRKQRGEQEVGINDFYCWFMCVQKFPTVCTK